MTTVLVPKSWISSFVMRYLAFSGWMMTSLKRQDGYLNQRVILSRLKYETHSIQMHSKSPCRSVVAPALKLLERRYAPSPLSSASVFTADLFCHPYYPESPPRLNCYPPASLLRSSLHCLPLFFVLRLRSFSTFSDRIFSSLYVVLYCTAWYTLLYTTFLTLRSDIHTTLFFLLL